MTDLTPDDRVLYRFLLDKLPADEREPVEERLFREPEFFETVEATEEEMILRYVRGELPDPWRSWFEAAYLGNASRRARVEEARTLLELAKSSRGPERAGRRRVQAAIAGGLIAASVVGVGIYRSRSGPAGPPAVVFQLDPGVLRGESGAAPLRLGRRAKSIRLELRIPAGAAGGRYEVVLGTPETPGLWKGQLEAGAAGTRTPVEIPASGLEGGDYILELRDGEQTVASYQFRVAR